MVCYFYHVICLLYRTLLLNTFCLQTRGIVFALTFKTVKGWFFHQVVSFLDCLYFNFGVALCRKSHGNLKVWSVVRTSFKEHYCYTLLHYVEIRVREIHRHHRLRNLLASLFACRHISVPLERHSHAVMVKCVVSFVLYVRAADFGVVESCSSAYRPKSPVPV